MSLPVCQNPACTNGLWTKAHVVVGSYDKETLTMYTKTFMSLAYVNNSAIFKIHMTPTQKEGGSPENGPLEKEMSDLEIIIFRGIFVSIKGFNRPETNITSVRLSPLPVRVTTRIITFLVGNPYKPSFPLLLGGGTTQSISLWNMLPNPTTAAILITVHLH